MRAVQRNGHVRDAAVAIGSPGPAPGGDVDAVGGLRASARRGRTWPAVVALFLLAAVIPESIATGNTPVLAYVIAPATLPFLAAFYGGAALTIRELRLRLSLGWRGIALLGVAFGFANEGVIAATWYRVAPTGYTYTPGHPGVDVAWAVFLTVFHVVVSVVIPILLVEAMFPRIARQRWVGRRGFVISAALPLLLTLVTLLSPSYRPQRLIVIAAIALLITLALRRRRRAEPTPVPSAPGLRLAGVARLRTAGAGLTVAFYAAGFLVPGICASATPRHLDVCQALYVLLMLTVAGVGTVVVRRWSRHPGWGQRQNVAVLTGLLIPAVVLTTATPSAFIGGAIILSGPFAAMLIWLARRYRRGLDDRGMAGNP